MNLAHSLKQEDYFLMKYEKLKGIFENEYKYQKQFDKRTKKTYHYIKVQTKTNPFFTEWYNKIYYKGKKKFTKEIADMFDKQAIAVFFFDEGYREKHCEAVDISMDDFDRESAELLKDRIEKLFDVKATITTRLGVRIPHKYGRKFKDEIKPYATNSVLYKLI